MLIVNFLHTNPHPSSRLIKPQIENEHRDESCKKLKTKAINFDAQDFQRTVYEYSLNSIEKKQFGLSFNPNIESLQNDQLRKQ